MASESDTRNYVKLKGMRAATYRDSGGPRVNVSYRKKSSSKPKPAPDCTEQSRPVLAVLEALAYARWKLEVFDTPIPVCTGFYESDLDRERQGKWENFES